ncbi:MAG: hypothetical protein QUV05_21760 [Phycisphaerae bacterium]|nr:hypothetical protein [Phycisphaerae bacterium]
MTKASRHTAALGVATLLSAAAGCSQVPVSPLTPPVPPVVWPKPPDTPRVQYLGCLVGSQSLHPKKSLSQTWDELLHGPKPPEVFVTPHAVAVHPDGRRVAVADTNGACVHLFDLQENRYERLTTVGQSESRLQCPVGAAWVGSTIWVADAKARAVAVMEGPASGWIGNDVLEHPAGIAFCPENGLCYVSDSAAHAIVAFDKQGTCVLRFGTRGSGPGQFNGPSHIACGPGPTLAVADSLNFRLQRLGPDGAFVGQIGRKGDAAGDLSLPKGVAFDPQGNIWVVDAHFENLQAFSPDGQLLLSFGQEGQGVGAFSLPAGLAIDAQGRIWVADTYNRRVQVFEILAS